MITCKRWLKVARRLGRWQPKYHADVDWYNNKYLNDAKKKKRKDKWKVSLKKAPIIYTNDFWQEWNAKCHQNQCQFVRQCCPPKGGKTPYEMYVLNYVYFIHGILCVFFLSFFIVVSRFNKKNTHRKTNQITNRKIDTKTCRHYNNWYDNNFDDGFLNQHSSNSHTRQAQNKHWLLFYLLLLEKSNVRVHGHTTFWSLTHTHTHTHRYLKVRREKNETRNRK